MLDTMMPLTGDDNMKTSKPKYACDAFADSKDFLNALKKECLERKALTRVERLQNTDLLQNWSSYVAKVNHRHQSVKEEKIVTRPPLTPPPPQLNDSRAVDKVDEPVESAACNDSQTPNSGTNDSTGQGRIYFLSENYDDVSGDESTNARSLESTNGVNHEMIERFLPLVDAMEQVVPSDTEDVLEEGGLIIDDAEGPAKQQFTVEAKGQPVAEDSSTETDSREDASARRDEETEMDCAGTETTKEQPSEPRVKRARTSKVRKSRMVLDKLRSAERKGKRPGTYQRPVNERCMTNSQPKEKGSGSDVPSEDDSSTTTVDGTEYLSSSDDENNKPKAPETEETAAQRHGVKRLVRNAEELRKSIVKDSLNEESRYNRLVQELPGFNWLEQKIMGHTSVPVKAPLTAPPPLNGKEKCSDGEVKGSPSVDILSRSMSEIQDEVCTETNEGETIKCVSTQTELSRNTPTSGYADQTSISKMDFKSRPPFIGGTLCSASLSPPSHPRFVKVPEGTVNPQESGKTWQPPHHPPGIPNGIGRQRGYGIRSPNNSDTDIMYIGEVGKDTRNENRKYPGAENHAQASHPPQPVPRPNEGLQHAMAFDAQQRALVEAQRQLFPWFYRPDGSGPPPLSPTGVPQGPLHGLTEMCQQGSAVPNAACMSDRMYGPPYIRMAQKAYQSVPLVPHGDGSARMNPMFSYFGLPRVFMPPYQRPSVQQPNDGHVTNGGTSAPQDKSTVGLRVPKSSELQKELQKNQRDLKPTQDRVSHPSRPSVAVAPQYNAQPPYPTPRRPSADRVNTMRTPPEAHCASPTKRTECAELPPLTIVRSQPTLRQEPATISPATPERHTPDKNDVTQSPEQELRKRKEELQYLDHLASQKEAEYERLVHMRAEKLRMLTELENRIRATNETEKQQAQKSPPTIVPLVPYFHQGTRAYKEPRSDSEGSHPPRPRPKYDNELQTSKAPQNASTPPRSIPGHQYPIHSPPTTAIPVMSAANIPVAVPLIGRGMLNVRSIDIPREIPPVVLHENAAPPGSENRSYYTSGYHRRASPTVPQNPQVKRAHSATDVQKQQEESRRMPAPPQPPPTIQRPFPQRAGKPSPVPAETRSVPLTFKEGHRPDLAAYYGQQNYPLAYYYGGAKTAEHLPYPGVQTYGGAVAHGTTGASHQAAGYPTVWRDYGVAVRGKFTHPTAPDQKERPMDPNSHRGVGADAKSSSRPSDEERAFYEQELARDVARMASNALTREAAYGTHQERSQRYAPQNPQKTQPAKEEPSKCALCGKYAQYLCSGCQSVWYCGQQCQKSNWSNHSSQCHNVKRSTGQVHDNQPRAQWSSKPDHDTDVHKAGRNETL
ncbi:uncharacterized protein LOC135370325 isoform X2 [Ornithodoros turicata]|uniref:uncharacterized protein LOC135370325 isoform X2 n=1 Tax=Ornithodoros turicata TaxID=34597 RepID=UPI003138CCFA